MYDITHNEKGLRNNYCGPAALSAIAGITSEQAAALLRHIGGRRAICTTYDREMIGAMKALGLKIQQKHFFGKPTVKKWKRPKGKLLVAVTGHYICVQSGKFWDNYNQTGTPLKKISRKKVCQAWVFTGRVNKKIIRELEDAKEKKAKAIINYRSKVKTFCEKNDCELKIMGGYIEINLPRGKVMYDGCHYIEDDRSNWDNAAEMWQHAFDRLEPLEDCDCGASCQVEEDEKELHACV